MRRVLAVLLASTGCAQVWGIDETSGGGGNDGPARVQMQRASIGASVVKAPLDLTGQSATFYDDSAGMFASVPGVLEGTSTFTADLAGTPSVSVTLPDMTSPRRLFALPARDQRAFYQRHENPTAQEPLPNSMLMLDIDLPTPYAPDEQFRVRAIGPWTELVIGANELPPPDGTTTKISVLASYKAFLRWFDRYAIEPTDKVRISASDVVLVTRTQGQYLTGVYQTQFDQTDGTDLLSGPLVPVQRTSQLMANITPMDYDTRFAAARPTVGNMAILWAVNAAPGWSIGDTVGVPLVQGSGGQTATMIADTFGNPFESLDWKAVFVYSAIGQRQHALTDGTNSVNMPLRAILTTVTEPTGTIDVTMPAGLPITIEANSTALVTDGQMLPLDLTQPVVVEATLDRTSNTAYALRVTEASIRVGGGGGTFLTTQVLLDAFTAGEPVFRVPPELFSVGKSYYFTFTAYQGGLTGAATGDLQTVTLPYTTASLDSAVFTVGMP